MIHRCVLYNGYFLTTKKDLLFSAIVVTNYLNEVGDFERSAVKDLGVAFLWDDPDQDQRSEITWIIVDQMNP